MYVFVDARAPVARAQRIANVVVNIKVEVSAGHARVSGRSRRRGRRGRQWRRRQGVVGVEIEVSQVKRVVDFGQHRLAPHASVQKLARRCNRNGGSARVGAGHLVGRARLVNLAIGVQVKKWIGRSTAGQRIDFQQPRPVIGRCRIRHRGGDDKAPRIDQRIAADQALTARQRDAPAFGTRGIVNGHLAGHTVFQGRGG